MNITITKGDKEYVFTYSTQKTEVTTGKHQNLTFHKWNCDELGAETFFGDYDSSNEAIKAKGESLINELDQVKSL